MLRAAVLGSMVVGSVLALGAVGPTATAQDGGQERIAALETAVADLTTRVAELEGDEGGAVVQSDALDAILTPQPRAEAPAPTSTPGAAAAEPSAATGTMDDPIPVGETADVGGWGVTLYGARVASYDEFLAVNQFNDPPTDERSFVLFDIEVTNNSAEAEAIFIALSFGALPPTNVGATASNAACGVVPEELETFTEVFPGGTVRGNFCLQLAADDLPETLFYAERSFDDETRTWFAADEAGA